MTIFVSFQDAYRVNANLAYTKVNMAFFGLIRKLLVFHAICDQFISKKFYTACIPGA